jgi:hypothetical protein
MYEYVLRSSYLDVCHPGTSGTSSCLKVTDRLRADCAMIVMAWFGLQLMQHHISNISYQRLYSMSTHNPQDS